ncbi:unnamed protein product [Rotaria socialis]|uniref:Uncharacterized protein n=1 Tax=Rotaria socialis TaxID=392032 RepID=A0A817SGG7_9BILA|nr:unnamed protein product [Rotaria socialis]
MRVLDAEQHREGLTRYIGVLRNSTDGNVHFEQVSQRQRLIHSNLRSMNRNPANGITPDVFVCFAGGPGTICELDFGIIA